MRPVRARGPGWALVPRLSEFFGLAVYMYWFDTQHCMSDIRARGRVWHERSTGRRKLGATGRSADGRGVWQADRGAACHCADPTGDHARLRTGASGSDPRVDTRAAPRLTQRQHATHRARGWRWVRQDWTWQPDVPAVGLPAARAGWTAPLVLVQRGAKVAYRSSHFANDGASLSTETRS
jgi:hypothetical protein